MKYSSSTLAAGLLLPIIASASPAPAPQMTEADLPLDTSFFMAISDIAAEFSSENIPVPTDTAYLGDYFSDIYIDIYDDLTTYSDFTDYPYDPYETDILDYATDSDILYYITDALTNTDVREQISTRAAGFASQAATHTKGAAFTRPAHVAHHASSKTRAGSKSTATPSKGAANDMSAVIGAQLAAVGAGLAAVAML